MGKLNWQAIRDEEKAYATIVIAGADVIQAMRTLAMRLDRAALIKYPI